MFCNIALTWTHQHCVSYSKRTEGCWHIWAGCSGMVASPSEPASLRNPLSLDTIRALENKHADQATPQPGADLNLTDLWPKSPPPNHLPVPPEYLYAPVPSGDLLPTMFLSDFLVPSPLLVTVSPLDPSELLVLSCSSALHLLLGPCGSSTSPWVSTPPAWHDAETSDLQAHVYTLACQPADSTFPHLHHGLSSPGTPLCSSIKTNLSESLLIFTTDFCASGCDSILTPLFPPGSFLSSVSPSYSLIPSSPW